MSGLESNNHFNNPEGEINMDNISFENTINALNANVPTEPETETQPEEEKQREKMEIKKQYPYWTDEDVEARYEIEHMEYRSAELVDYIHGGYTPARALKEYKAKLEKLNNGIYTEHVTSPSWTMYTIIDQYDEHGRIILSKVLYDDKERGEHIYKYTYNPDGTHTQAAIRTGSKYDADRNELWEYDEHGKIIRVIYNDKDVKDLSEIKFHGDYL